MNINFNMEDIKTIKKIVENLKNEGFDISDFEALQIAKDLMLHDRIREIEFHLHSIANGIGSTDDVGGGLKDALYELARKGES